MVLPAPFALHCLQGSRVDHALSGLSMASRQGTQRQTKGVNIMAQNEDIYTRVTNKIIADLENGQRTWMKPWHADHLAGRITKPLRHNGLAYQGLNIILLWAAAVDGGYISDRWMTFKQAKGLGGHVMKGMRGQKVIYADKIIRTETDGNGEEQDRMIYFTKSYTVFNTEQIDGLPEEYYTKPEPVNPDIQRDEQLDRFFAATGATIRHGGNQAYYNVSADFVQMPYLECFRDSEGYYATLAHEMTHWTRHARRLNRDFGRKTWGDAGYAQEELVAELGSAFLCAELGITPEIREDHAAYIDSWLTVLRNDKKAIFRAAAHAQRAVDHLKQYQATQQEAAS
jgi:antirestriction protein ArdC